MGPNLTKVKELLNNVCVMSNRLQEVIVPPSGLGDGKRQVRLGQNSNIFVKKVGYECKMNLHLLSIEPYVP